MKLTCLRLTEIAAATLVSSTVLLVSVTPAVFGAGAPSHHAYVAAHSVPALAVGLGDLGPRRG